MTMTQNLRNIAKACYPTWRGRKICTRVATTYAMHNYWDGGSRSYATAYDLSSGHHAEAAHFAPWHDLANATVPIPAGVVVVEHSIFCGHDVGIVVIGAADDLARLADVAAPRMLAKAVRS